MRFTSILTALPAIALLGCDPDPGAGPPGYIAPLDGQTAIPVDMDLVVHTSTLELPPDWPSPDLIRVVDLEDGGLVHGTITYDGHELRFRPLSRWIPGRRYAWTLDPIEDIPHAPEVNVEPHLVGTAVFDTSDDLYLLAGNVASASEACLVFSRPLTTRDGGAIRITVDDVELRDVQFTQLPPNQWGTDYRLDSLDPSVSVACITPSEPIEAGGVLRMWWGELGPWRVDLQDALLPDVFDKLRRGVAP